MAPAELAKLTGLSPEMQRDWRKRGYIENFGTIQPNGRWLYDKLDAFYLCSAQRIYEMGIDLPLSIRFSSAIHLDVFKWCLALAGQVELGQARFIRFHRDPAFEEEPFGGWVGEGLLQ